MNKKAEFNIQTFMIGILIFSGIIISLTGVAYKLGTIYHSMSGVTVDNSFSTTYNKINQTISQAEEIQNKFEQSDVGEQDSSAQFYGGALATLKLIRSTLSLVPSMAYDMVRVLGIDPMWAAIAVAVLVILVFTAMLFMIFKPA